MSFDDASSHVQAEQHDAEAGHGVAGGGDGRPRAGRLRGVREAGTAHRQRAREHARLDDREYRVALKQSEA